MPVYHKVTPPTFSLTSLTIHRYQFKLLGEKDTLKVTCFAQNHNILTRLGLNRDHTLDPDCQRTNHHIPQFLYYLSEIKGNKKKKEKKRQVNQLLCTSFNEEEHGVTWLIISLLRDRRFFVSSRVWSVTSKVHRKCDVTYHESHTWQEIMHRMRYVGCVKLVVITIPRSLICIFNGYQKTIQCWRCYL